MQQTRIGVLGAGFVGKEHLDRLLNFDDARVVAVADPLLDRARRQAARCGATAYDDYEQMLDAEELDALYICVPPFAHGPPRGRPSSAASRSSWRSRSLWIWRPPRRSRAACGRRGCLPPRATTGATST